MLEFALQRAEGKRIHGRVGGQVMQAGGCRLTARNASARENETRPAEIAPLDGVGQLRQQLGQSLVAIGVGRMVGVRRGDVEIGGHEISAPREGGS